MKKILLLMAMLFVIAGLMAVARSVVAETNHPSQNERFTRDIFYTEDFETGATGWTHFDGAVTPNNWHVYANGDAQGNVWWMGDEAIGGYHDHQYLVLNTPAIPITTGNSTLTFKMKHGLEEPGVSGEYDGWDSFNIRISTNSGLTYTVIPGTAITSPAYDFANSFAFGSEFGEGVGVPGWGGQRDWTTVTVDLSSYLVAGAANAIIRFAFAADPAYSTVDDATLFGVKIDDIALAGFSNNGVDTGMTYASLVPTAGDFWHLATDVSAPSPTHIMSSMNNAGTYAMNMLNYLESPSIVLPVATQIVADFQLKGTFADTGTFPDVDYFGWEISPDNGTTWRYMSNPSADTTGSNYVYSSAPDNWASMINSYTLDGDITIFAGNTVKFRWYFQSNDNSPNGTPLQIDNFQIFSVTAAPAAVNLVYPINNQANLPYTGFNFDWSPSSLGANPEYYNVYVDADLANLEELTFNPAYSLLIEPVLSPADSLYYLYSYCNTSDIPDFVLAAGETWYWRVVSGVVGQTEAFSEIWRFDTVPASSVVTTFPWNEGFEAGVPPAGWTIGNVDGDATTWASFTGATYIHGGTKSAFHAYSTLTADPGQNGWLITPAIELPETGVAAISFWNYNRYGYEVYNGLMINTNPDPTSTTWTELWTQDTAAGVWSQETVNLAAYGGNVVYFAFKYTGYDGNNWYVDDVNISVYTGDVLPPILSKHLPLINTPREDLTWPVSVNVVDDAVFNNPVTAVNLYWSLNAGTTWSAAIPMTLGTGTMYEATLPAQALGSTVTYKFEAFDSLNNMGTASYTYDVADPTWMWYDTGGTGYTGFATYNWGPGVWFENPFYGTDTTVRLLGSDGAIHNNTAGNGPTMANMHVYGEDFAGNLTSLMPTLPVEFIHRTYRTVDLSSYNIEITTPWFWISYEDLGTNRYFLYDATYDYTSPLYLFIGGDLYTSTSTGEWCIGAQVQTGGPALYFAPELSIAQNVSGNQDISWTAVDGAASYDVYGASSPYADFPADWTVLADNTALTSYTYTGAAPMQFFKVVASTNAGGSRTITLKGSRNHPTNASVLSVIPNLVKDDMFQARK